MQESEFKTYVTPNDLGQSFKYNATAKKTTNKTVLPSG